MRILVFILMLFFNTTSANEIIITFNPLDCITCTSGLFFIGNEGAVSSVKIVVREIYKEDSAELNEKFEFYKYPKLKVMYNDKLYTKLNGHSNDIEKNKLFIISNDGKKVVYAQELNKLNLTQLKAILNNAASNNALIKSASDNVYNASTNNNVKLRVDDSICYSAINKKLNLFDVNKNDIISADIFGKFAFYNTDEQKLNTVFKIDSAAITFLYKCYYRNKFKERFPVINAIMDESPSFKPFINSVKYVSKDTAVITIQVKDYFIDGKNDTALLGHGLVLKYNSKYKKILAAYTADETVSKDFYMWYVYSNDNKFYAQGLDGDDFCFYELVLNDKKQTYSLGSRVIKGRPEKYKNLKVPSTEEDNIIFNDGICAFVYDNVIFDLVKGRTFTIPLSDAANFKEHYKLIDIKQDDKYFYMLYLSGSNILSSKLSRNSTEFKEIVIGDKYRIDEYNAKFYNSGNKIIYRPVDKNCLYVSNISY